MMPPVPPTRHIFQPPGAVNETVARAEMSFGVGMVYPSDRFFPPNRAAQPGSISMPVTFPF